MKGTLVLYVVHVAGTWMQAEGADGSSQGDQTMGVMSGQPILNCYVQHSLKCTRIGNRIGVTC
jgi:hypothetical protein